jgi:CBS domain-containing protein
MSYRPIAIGAFESVQSAAQLMRAQVIGILPVVERGRLVGVVTDRDLVVRCLALGARPWDTYVREVMTDDPATCRPEEPVAVAIERMIGARVRRLIVVEGTDVVGLLTTDDLVLVDETRSLALRALQHLAALRGEIDGMFTEPRP